MKAHRRTLITLEVIIAVAALGGAIGLVGGSIDMGEDIRTQLPFESQPFGGVWLFLSVCLVPTVVAVAEIRKAAWAAQGHVVVGLVLMTWILVQVALIGLVSWMQPAVFLYGVVIAVIATMDLVAADGRQTPSSGRSTTSEVVG